VLAEAGIADAAGVIVAPDTDEAAVLTTLTAREQNKRATIVAAVREPENRHLIHESGANTAIVSSGAAGQMLGLATTSPALVEVLEDLMAVGTGLDMIQRDVLPEDVGKQVADVQMGEPVIAIVRGEETLRFDKAGPLQASDKIVCLCSTGSAA
jgi:voltage-gated potassium channel